MGLAASVFVSIALGSSNAHAQSGDRVDILFMITAGSAQFLDGNFLIPQDAHTVAFSDRPYRLAKVLKGGALHFANFYNASDFTTDPPNVTFAGLHEGSKEETVSIFELGEPTISDNNILFPVVEWIGDEKPVENGQYSNISLVVDNIVGDWLVGIATVGATFVACTVGEVASMGADTAVCAAGVVATAGEITNGVAD